jgi:hypothetical protein
MRKQDDTREITPLQEMFFYSPSHISGNDLVRLKSKVIELFN